jgi:restriction system protein
MDFEHMDPEKPLVKGKELTLTEWLELMAIPADARDVVLFPDFCFPSDKHADDYVSAIRSRDPEEVISLIRAFLVPTGSLGGDTKRIKYFLVTDPGKAIKIEQVRRTLRGEPPWEGITWILDLLHRPRMAIDVVRAYLAAHFWWLPDGRINGLTHAMLLIRAAFVEPIHPRDELLAISPRDFELLAALLFEHRSYEVNVTRRSQDGGYDIRLINRSTTQAESSVVECKRYTNRVGVKEVRSLLGVVEREHATRGLLVTTADFTRGAVYEASQTTRIELIDYNALCMLFNESFGPDWLMQIDALCTRAQRRFDDQGR